MRVERLLRKMEERARRRQKRKDEVKIDRVPMEHFHGFVLFSGRRCTRVKFPKVTMIRLKWKIFVMHEIIWEIIS